MILGIYRRNYDKLSILLFVSSFEKWDGKSDLHDKHGDVTLHMRGCQP